MRHHNVLGAKVGGVAGGQERKDFSPGGKEKTKSGEKERRGRTTIPPISATNRHKKDRRRTVLVPKVSFDVLRPFTVHVQARSIEEERKKTKRKHAIIGLEVSPFTYLLRTHIRKWLYSPHHIVYTRFSPHHLPCPSQIILQGIVANRGMSCPEC